MLLPVMMICRAAAVDTTAANGRRCLDLHQRFDSIHWLTDEDRRAAIREACDEALDAQYHELRLELYM
jgi:hypothetical protein